VAFIDPLGRARILARSGEIPDAIEAFTELAISGNAQAMAELAVVYIQNRGVFPITDSEIEDLLQNAIKLGNSDAQNILEQAIRKSLIQVTQRKKSTSKETRSETPSPSKHPEETVISHPKIADSYVNELRTKVKNEDPQAAFALVALYVNNPQEFGDYLRDAYYLIQGLIGIGNDRAKDLFSPLAVALISTDDYEFAELALFEGLYFGDKESIPRLLKLLGYPGTEFKQACQNLANSRNLQNIFGLVQQLRKIKRISAIEFWLIKSKNHANPLADVELAKLYQTDLADTSKFESLLRKLELENSFLFHLVMAQSCARQHLFDLSVEHLEMAHQLDSESELIIIELYEVFDKWKQDVKFSTWITDPSRESFLPLIKTAIKRFQSLGDLYEVQVWSEFDDEVSRILKSTITAHPQEKLSISSIELSSSSRVITSYESWLADSSEHLVPTYIHKNSRFLQSVYSLNRTFYPLIDDWMQVDVRDEWLDEILAKYEDQYDFLNLDPTWPQRFESSDLQIVLSVEGQWIRGWVGRKDMGGIVAIRLTDFEINSALQGSDLKYTVGVLVSFFLDRTINSPSHQHPHFSSNPDGSVSGSQSFTKDVLDTQNGSRQAMQSHMVSGSIRRLPKGHTPSYEAVMRAPLYVRRKMRPNETFVRAHQRNGPVHKEAIIRYLQTKSNLADAIGMLSKYR
jgi:hypothetical protein